MPERFDENEVKALSQSLDGEIALPNEDRYKQAVTLENGHLQRSPALVIFPKSVRDIQLAFAICQRKSLRLSVKSGGHSYAGYCLNNYGVVLDLCQLKHIRQTCPESITVEMGAVWSDVYDFLELNGSSLLPIGGACSGVGVAGFVLGGGYSFLSRSFGLGCDSLLALTIVTADGQIRKLDGNSPNPDENDLFWACKGGGGGNFGVVVDMTLRLHRPNSQTILAGMLYFTEERIDSVLRFYGTWAESLTNEMSVYGFLGRDIVLGKRGVECLRLQPVFNGDFQAGISHLRSLFQLGPSYVNLCATNYFDYLRAAGSKMNFSGKRAYTRSGFLRRGDFSSDFVDRSLRNLQRSPSPHNYLLWMHQGGASNLVASTDTAFPHRQAEYVIELTAQWETADEADANIEWALKFGEELAPLFEGAYVNYIDPLLRDWPLAYYGINYDKLKRVKSIFDADFFFNFEQAIASEM